MSKREANKRWREKNKEYLREYQKKYREEHKAELAEKRRQYYQKNREKVREYNAKPERREKVRECSRRYYERHKNDPEYIAKDRANHAKWQRENKDRINAYNRERRKSAKMKGGRNEILSVLFILHTR